jgi:hypothetical protein
MQSTLQILATAEAPAFVPAHAPIAVLLFLGTGAFLLAAAGTAAVCLAVHRRALALRIAAAGLAVGAGYAALLLGVSLASRDRTLAPGTRKYFCEIDCHLAYSVAGAERTKTVGVRPAALTAQGRFTVVRIRTFFDPSTIGPSRGNGPLSPGPREARIVDSAGRSYGTSAAATRVFEKAKGGFSRLTQARALAPGQSYETALVFDLPEDARDTRLFLGGPDGLDRAIVGHESSPFHAKVFFAIPL